MIVDLTEQEWQSVIACMGYAPARESVPYMNKIGAQLTPQLQQHGNSKDMPATIPTDNITDPIPKRSN